MKARGLAAALALATAVAGCAWAPPKPWEKGELARPAMQFDADRKSFEPHRKARPGKQPTGDAVLSRLTQDDEHAI